MLFSLHRLSRLKNLQINTLINHFSLKYNMRDWQLAKETILSMPIEEKRKLYKSGQFYILSQIPTWYDYAENKKANLPPPAEFENPIKLDTALNETLAKKISIFQGDITSLEIDCIVNAANKTLLGGGGVDGAIHKAAGQNLLSECKTLSGCNTGEAKMTGGYNLPAKYVIHTVGPIGEHPGPLRECYFNSLELMVKNKLRSIAFPCISTGIYGYPGENAAHVAVPLVREYLQKNHEDIDRVIFCIFLDSDLKVYERVLQVYFPVN